MRELKSYRIRASSVYMFGQNPKIWLDENIKRSKRKEVGVNALIGTLVHKAIELNEADAILPEYDKKIAEESYEAHDIKDVILKAEAMFSAYKGFENKPIVKEQEERLTYLCNFDRVDFEITGQFDAITTDGAILDYKTGAKTVSKPSRAYYDQLDIYAHLLLETRGERIEKGKVLHIAQPNSKGVAINLFEFEISPERGAAYIKEMMTAVAAYHRLPQYLRDIVFRPNRTSFIEAA